MLQLKVWFVLKQSPNLELRTCFLALKECENSHTLTTTATTGSKNSQKEANNQTDNQNIVLSPPFSTDSCSWMKSSARDTLNNDLS